MQRKYWGETKHQKIHAYKSEDPVSMMIYSFWPPIKIGTFQSLPIHSAAAAVLFEPVEAFLGSSFAIFLADRRAGSENEVSLAPLFSAGSANDVLMPTTRTLRKVLDRCIFAG